MDFSPQGMRDLTTLGATVSPTAAALQVPLRHGMMQTQAANQWLEGAGFSRGGQLPGQTGPRRIPWGEALRAAGGLRGLARMALGGMAVPAAVEGSWTAAKTPVDVFARRNSMELPSSEMGMLGLRALGTLQNIGNAASLGTIGEAFWPPDAEDAQRGVKTNWPRRAYMPPQGSGGLGQP